MKLIKKIYWPILGVIVFAVIFQMANTTKYFGLFINKFHSCVNDPASSFPCYGIYDLMVMAISIVAIWIFSAIILFQVVKFIKIKA